MPPTLAAPAVLVALFGVILACLEVGLRLGRRSATGAERPAGLGAVEGAVFGLMGLLLAFTFSGAAQRFDDRRHLIVQEANAVGTAWLRLDLLPPAAQPALREDFRRYLDARLAFYRALPDLAAARREDARVQALQQRIWTGAVAAAREGAHPSAPMLLLPALNEMIDITTTRTAAMRMHPPPIIFGMMLVAVLASALLAGWGMAATGARSWLHVLGFALLISVAVYVIADLEFPRLGLIRVDSFDDVLAAVRSSMGVPAAGGP